MPVFQVKVRLPKDFTKPPAPTMEEVTHLTCSAKEEKASDQFRGPVDGRVPRDLTTSGQLVHNRTFSELQGSSFCAQDRVVLSTFITSPEDALRGIRQSSCAC